MNSCDLLGCGDIKRTVNEIGVNDLDEYDELVDRSTEGTIFHKTWWLNNLKGYYCNTFKMKFYGVFENGNLIAGIPIPIHSKFGLNFIYNPKLTPYLGTVFIKRKFDKVVTEITWKKDINNEIANVLKSQGSCIYYSFTQGFSDLQPFKWVEFEIGVNYTYILKLDELGKLLENMDKKRRNDITKNYKYNYRIELGDIETFIKLNSKTMQRQNHAFLGEDIWNQVYNESRTHRSCEIFSIYKNNEAVASLFLVWDNKRSYYLGGGIRNNSGGAMSLLMWEAIKYTKEKLNLKEFDFEGSSVHSIEFYFRKFGGEMKPIFYISEASAKKFLISYIYYKFRK